AERGDAALVEPDLMEISPLSLQDRPDPLNREPNGGRDAELRREAWQFGGSRTREPDARDPRLRPADGARSEGRVEGNDRGGHRVHHPPEPARWPVGCVYEPGSDAARLRTFSRGGRRA